MGKTSDTVSIAEGDGAARDPNRAAAQLIVALEADRPHALSSRHLLAGSAEVRLGRADRGATRITEAGAKRLEIGIPDRAMSSAHARILPSRGRWILEDAGSKNGSLVNGVAKPRAVLLDGDLIELGHTLFLYRDAVAVVAPDEPDLDGETPATTTLSQTFVASFADALAALARVARSDVAVTLLGDTGTGKEVISRAVHLASRRSGAFVPVNCGAIPPNLIEATLFGHRKGAFSGAMDDRPGLVRSADKGTLFLDEIGDLPLASQTAFLRVLQEQEVIQVGDSRPIKVDFRLIAATHRSLTQLVAGGAFREDLYARMTGFTVRLPRLAERGEDLGMLISRLLAKHDPGGAVTLHIRAARALFDYEWPMNVRELEKVLTTALAVADGQVIRLEHLPEALRGDRSATSGGPVGPPTNDERLRDELVALLRQHGGNVAAVAQTMGKGRMQIHRWLKRFELSLEDFRK